MSSENLHAHDAAMFRWHDGLDRDRYAFARYTIETAAPPDLAALGMAREQSVCTTRLATGAPDLSARTARVVDVRVLGAAGEALLPEYSLRTPIYVDADGSALRAEVTIAFAIDNLGRGVDALLNHVYGELPRLGFLRAVRLETLELPETLLARYRGPAMGIAGLRARAAVAHRPLLCRSTRPALGLDTASMLAISAEVLRGGFDLIKDDELTPHHAPSPVRERWRAFAELTRALGAETGERKGFFVSLIDQGDEDPGVLAEIAARAEALGGLIAPGLQGFTALRRLTGTRDLAALAHNTGADALTRAPRLGIAAPLWLRLARLAGADLALLPGEFATASCDATLTRACLDALRAPWGGIRPCLPVLAGGKRAEELGDYVSLCGDGDFMLIVASAVDEHDHGPRAGAQAFRAAWQRLSG